MKSKNQKIKELKSEIKALDKERKHYKLQSEWHRMMYAKTLALETLESIAV